MYINNILNGNFQKTMCKNLGTLIPLGTDAYHHLHMPKLHALRR